MEGILVNFRLGKHTKSNNQMVLLVAGIDSKEKAGKLVGKMVSWKSPGAKPTEIKGKVSGPHGRNGCVKVVFEKGMPGQAVGKKVIIA
jgi:large subunit ribosomal protein L35Ae